MTTQSAARRAALLTGLAGVLCLDGALALPFVLAFLTSGLMGAGTAMPTLMEIVLFIAALTIVASGGWLWGRVVARIHGLDAGRLARASLLSYGPAVMIIIFALGSLEPIAADVLPLPIHRVFTAMFVPAVFLVAAAVGGALGAALRDRAAGLRLALAGGLAAAIGFAIVNLALDALGFRVGAPFAAERATMLVTALTSNAGAALAGSTVMGLILQQRATR